MTSWIWAGHEVAELHSLHGLVKPGSTAFINGGTSPQLWGFVRPSGDEAAWMAAGEFVAAARQSVTVIPPGRGVTVVGAGLLGHVLRRLLWQNPASAGSESPTVVDTTGSTGLIRESVARLPRLGHLVLAAPVRDTHVDLATYRDLHVRALMVTGMSWPPAAGRPADGPAIGDALRMLVRVRAGSTPPRGTWYSIAGDEAT